jgi:Flp pilus assembly protein TadB
MHRTRPEPPTLITSAPQTPDDEYNRRRKRYAIMMASRALCVIAAALTYHVSIWLALGFVISGSVLPWCAVIIANDRPPKRRAERPPLLEPVKERGLPGRTDRTISS